MNDIIYGDKDQGLLGVEDLGDGYKLAVINVGGLHHCAYVQFPDIERIIGDYNVVSVDAHVHGGFTFLGDRSKYGLEGTWLGWDYAHIGDYIFGTCRSYVHSEKMWTTAEVVEEGLDILKAIKAGKISYAYMKED